MFKIIVNIIKALYFNYFSKKSKRERILLSQYHRAQALPDWGIRVWSNNLKAKQIDISVVVTCFNYSLYIQDSLRSVFSAAKYKPEVELIVVDDCSRDDSNTKIKQLLKNSPIAFCLIRTFWNVGVSKARNIGINHAKGRYIFILDADNKIYSKSLKNLFDTIVESNADAAFGPIDRFAIDGTFVDQISHMEFSPTHLLNQGNYIDAMALFRKDKIIDIGGYDVNLLKIIGGWEDYNIWLKMVDRGCMVAFMPYKIGIYRIKPDSMVKKITNEEIIAFRNYASSLYKNFKALADIN
jgi:glycosyltransferase involved in cell wall biosynthesis